MMDRPTVACLASGGSGDIGNPVDPRVLSCIADLSILGKDIEALSRALCMCMDRVERNRNELLGVANDGCDAGRSWTSELSKDSKQLVPDPSATQQLSNRGNLLAQRVKQFNAPKTFQSKGDRVVDRLITTVMNIAQSVSACRKRAMDYRKSVGSNRFDRFVGGEVFSGVSISMIWVNTVYLGFEADRILHNNYARLVGLPAAGSSVNLNYFFASFFVLELCLRMMSERVVFFVGPDMVWNLFDIALVVTSIIELLDDGVPNMTFGRTFRFFRLLRLARVCRASRVFQNLRTMLFSIVGTFVALSWAFVLMAFLLYTCALILVNGVSSYYQKQDGHTIEVEEVQKVYTSVIVTMLRLFEGITGGISWTELTKQLIPVGQFYRVVFLAYVFIMFFGILNTVTGIVVDGAIQQAHADRREIVREESERQRQQMRELQTIFMQADVDNSGSLSWAEFETHLSSEEIQIILETMSIGTHELFELFQLLDTNGTDSVGIDEFVGGVMRLKGTARSVDLTQLMASFSFFVNGPFRTVSEGVTELIHDSRTQSQRMQARVTCVEPPSQAQECSV
eukprot:TRINITY_DN2959_c0_g1_i2.p1 TRINITY_DN2959_c0_g1~~TRINITY_DN2959_c0_g1_i2.p1  ORF type:complete len:567 (+),score=60.27 TRINITY_DN2959_c0_g1_i2:96-1796(+)